MVLPSVIAIGAFRGAIDDLQAAVPQQFPERLVITEEMPCSA
jgi:hypothetical protein